MFVAPSPVLPSLVHPQAFGVSLRPVVVPSAHVVRLQTKSIRRDGTGECYAAYLVCLEVETETFSDGREEEGRRQYFRSPVFSGLQDAIFVSAPIILVTELTKFRVICFDSEVMPAIRSKTVRK